LGVGCDLVGDEWGDEGEEGEVFGVVDAREGEVGGGVL